MSNNKLILAVAGSGKTTYLVSKALETTKENVLIVTYTEANEKEIKRKFIDLKGYIPSNITIQTWFSFLLQHGVRPFQDIMHKDLKKMKIGFYLTEQQSGIYTGSNGRTFSYGEDSDFSKFYFTRDSKIYSDKVSKFVISCNNKSRGELVSRITRVYPNIFIDEVQDLAGWDLEILKLLFMEDSNILMVGDPRQVTYLTHHPRKYSKYMDGKIADFIDNECPKDICEIDTEILSKTHRNSEAICLISSNLFTEHDPSLPCDCPICRNYITNHVGVFLVKEQDVEKYCIDFSPTVLKWNKAVYPDWNFGKSKGLSFDRVLIYPTDPIIRWLRDNSQNLSSSSRCKFYVALTRARMSVGIVYNYRADEVMEDVKKYSP